ncbi:hypothetical protein MHYP_G00190660 [Metynnis hypsauchen]
MQYICPVWNALYRRGIACRGRCFHISCHGGRFRKSQRCCSDSSARAQVEISKTCPEEEDNGGEGLTAERQQSKTELALVRSEGFTSKEHLREPFCLCLALMIPLLPGLREPSAI